MQKPGFNPFYVLLVIVGVAFCITACAYGVMTVKKLHPAETTQAEASGQAFVDAVDAHGFPVMMVELGLLAIATFAAIATDDYWTGPSKKPGTAKTTGTANNPGDSPTNAKIR